MCSRKEVESEISDFDSILSLAPTNCITFILMEYKE